MDRDYTKEQGSLTEQESRNEAACIIAQSNRRVGAF